MLSDAIRISNRTDSSSHRNNPLKKIVTIREESQKAGSLLFVFSITIRLPYLPSAILLAHFLKDKAHIIGIFFSLPVHKQGSFEPR